MGKNRQNYESTICFADNNTGFLCLRELFSNKELHISVEKCQSFGDI
jgi:hypothetical protein